MVDMDELNTPNCPVDLEAMEVTDSNEWPLWECPVCGMRRAHDEGGDGWWTTLNLPGREAQPLVLDEDADGGVLVKFNRRDVASGPWSSWREAEQAARAWLESHPPAH